MAWNIPKMWEDGECWIIGGGSSIPRLFGIPEDVVTAVQHKELPIDTYSPYLSALHGKHVIGVNIAFMLGNWVDVLVFGDGAFYGVNKQAIDGFRKLKISLNKNASPKMRGVVGLKMVERDNHIPFGISTRPNKVSWNKNTGAASINLAYHFGVKRIMLLGFDMKVSNNGSQHWHGHYKAPPKQGEKRRYPFRFHLPAFEPIRNDAKRLGLEILNVNDDSDIRELPMVKLEDVL